MFKPAVLALLAAALGFALADLLAWLGLIEGGTVTQLVRAFHAGHAWLPAAYLAGCAALAMIGWIHFGMGRKPGA